MPKNLVIVESPAKAKTIERYLGSDYKVVASLGHVRDLPKSKLGIDVKRNFKPDYIIPKGSAKRLKDLKAAMAKAQTIYLATDLDREGEAIAWHILEAIPPENNQKVGRITFTEITPTAIQQAVLHPRAVNQPLVDAQQARRVVDRLVGYTLSPVLWKKIRSGLSAGRVQSVALKLTVDREREIEAFKPQEYWSVEVLFQTDKREEFRAELIKIDDKKPTIIDQKTAEAIKGDLAKADFKIKAIDEKEIKKTPLPPFITSTLQRSSYSYLGYGTKRTMTLAQALYEAGHISYMRTDSLHLNEAALKQAKQVIQDNYGKRYALTAPRVFKRQLRAAQEAHEAIRPTDFSNSPRQLSQELPVDQAKLYGLIWSRAVASQMSEALFRQKRVDILDQTGKYGLHASGRQTVFDGFTKVYNPAASYEDKILPAITKQTRLTTKAVDIDKHFTQPPARYSEATLVKVLEENGVGRPSTYAPTISTLITRGYVTSEDKRLVPQPVGKLVSDLLTKNFDFVVDPKFTAAMEDKLDGIAEGKYQWQPVVKDFYDPIEQEVTSKLNNIEKVTIPVEETDEICERCGKKMVVKSGRFGRFLACSGFPECKNTKPLIETTGVACPKCGQGEVVERRTKKGRLFFGCSRYPECDYASWQKPIAEKAKKQ